MMHAIYIVIPTSYYFPPAKFKYSTQQNKFHIYLKLFLDKFIQLRNSEIKTFTTPLILDTEGKQKLILGKGMYCHSSE